MRQCARFFGSCVLGVAVSCLPLSAQSTSLGSAPPPKVDKQALVDYLRYAEGFTPSVNMTLDNPEPTIFAGFYKILVHLKSGKNEAVRTYYLTQDGQRLVAAPIFDLQKSPFITNLESLKQEGAPAFGPASAPVTIYVFSDFQCPYCQEEAKVLRQGIDKDLASQVRIIFKNFPLESIHPWARAAAISGVCIARQSPDKFWSFHDWVYQHQSEINPSNVHDKITDFAKTQSLNSQQLSSCIDSTSAAAEVDSTITEGRNLGLVQTPSLFVNGRLVSGALPAGQVNLLIRMELDHQKKQAALADKTPQKCCEIPIPTLTKK